MYYQYDKQQLRRKRICDAIINAYPEDFEKGSTYRWNCFGLKENSWLIFALLEHGDKYTGMIERIFDEKSDELSEYHTFLSFIFINLILRYKQNISEKVRLKMEKHLKDNADISMADAWNFMGVNDNTPAMIAAALILGGEYFNEHKWVECGKRRFCELKEMLERREFLSEFNSPTYTPITICAAAAVAEFSKECGELALEIEAKLWDEFLKLAYLPIANSAGPFSRAYPRDKLGMTHNSRALLYMLFGEKMKVNPLSTVFNEEYKVDNEERMYIQLAVMWMCSINYHCPIKIAENFLGRTYPYEASGKAELSSSADSHLLEIVKGNAKYAGDLGRDNIFRTDTFDVFKRDDCFDYPCAVSEIYTYMTEKYALGTCTVDFHSGVQTDSFTMYYTKNGCEAESQEDIGAVFCNYIINEDVSYRNDHGRKIAFQKDNHAMVLYSPSKCSETLQSAKLSIYFSNYKNLIEEIKAGDTVIKAAELKPKQKIKISYGNVYLRMKSIYCHFKPLVNVKDTENAFLEISSDNDTLILSIYNYSGADYKIKNKELRSITNGFVFNVEDAGNVTFEEFTDKYDRSTVSDRVICNVHNRYTMMREVKYRCDDIKLSCCISPINSGIKYLSVD